MNTVNQRIAEELSIQASQADAAISLLDDGATVPFISRYRKEATGGLDDTQMRQLELRLRYLRELEDRRQTILKSISDQGKLTPALAQQIDGADAKIRLEDLYLPYKQKRRTKAQLARESGLEPLVDAILADPGTDPLHMAERYIDDAKGVVDAKSALEGARQILMERFSEDAGLLGNLRRHLSSKGNLSSRVILGKEQAAAKYRDYFEYDEPFRKVPSHRALAMFRGRKEGFLQLSITAEYTDANTGVDPCEAMVARHWKITDSGRAADGWLQETIQLAWRVKLLAYIETDLLRGLREFAETEAIRVFGSNLKDVLLAAPAGARTTMGLDPGLRTGVKVAVVDKTGKVVDHCTVYPNAPQNKSTEAMAAIHKLAEKHGVELVAIGNGTASRETDRFVADIIRRYPSLELTKVMVNESGASIYSASEFAAKEFPDLDVTIRGAVSIARRLQDPLAELVKIEPKSIGVGQYQHDINQGELARQLDAVVEDCVNGVGVDVNTASAPLLSRVSGLNQNIAGNIVAYRDQHGGFLDRDSLKKVPRLGEKTYEQAAGFLRIMAGKNALDASAVHPEAYRVVESIAQQNERSVATLIGDSAFLHGLNAGDYVTADFGIPTVTDIILELDKPGRDPRPEFKTAGFKDGVETLKDLRENMVLEGTVTNVTNFGAFVDVGVHQDGLVHISALSKTFVKDPRQVVKAGDVVKVKVMSVDIARKRIALTMRMEDTEAGRTKTQKINTPGPDRKKAARKEQKIENLKSPSANNAFAQAFAQAGKK